MKRIFIIDSIVSSKKSNHHKNKLSCAIIRIFASLEEPGSNLIDILEISTFTVTGLIQEVLESNGTND